MTTSTLIACADCGTMISPRAASCPKCGCPVSERRPVDRSTQEQTFSDNLRMRQILAFVLFLAIVAYAVSRMAH